MLRDPLVGIHVARARPTDLDPARVPPRYVRYLRLDRRPWGTQCAWPSRCVWMVFGRTVWSWAQANRVPGRRSGEDAAPLTADRYVCPGAERRGHGLVHVGVQPHLYHVLEVTCVRVASIDRE